VVALATRPYDPTCAEGCEELLTGSDPHAGGLRVMLDPLVDDPVAQWGDCVGEVVACLSEGGEPRPCVAGAGLCPSSCVALYDREAGAFADRDELLDAFERVFIDEGAPCAPATVSP
jgi:hypothetical protein